MTSWGEIGNVAQEECRATGGFDDECQKQEEQMKTDEDILADIEAARQTAGPFDDLLNMTRSGFTKAKNASTSAAKSAGGAMKSGFEKLSKAMEPRSENPSLLESLLEAPEPSGVDTTAIAAAAALGTTTAATMITAPTAAVAGGTTMLALPAAEGAAAVTGAAVGLSASAVLSGIAALGALIGLGTVGVKYFTGKHNFRVGEIVVHFKTKAAGSPEPLLARIIAQTKVIDNNPTYDVEHLDYEAHPKEHVFENQLAGIPLSKAGDTFLVGERVIYAHKKGDEKLVATLNVNNTDSTAEVTDHTKVIKFSKLKKLPQYFQIQKGDQVKQLDGEVGQVIGTSRQPNGLYAQVRLARGRFSQVPTQQLKIVAFSTIRSGVTAVLPPPVATAPAAAPATAPAPSLAVIARGDLDAFLPDVMDVMQRSSDSDLIALLYAYARDKLKWAHFIVLFHLMVRNGRLGKNAFTCRALIKKIAAGYVGYSGDDRMERIMSWAYYYSGDSNLANTLHLFDASGNLRALPTTGLEVLDQHGPRFHVKRIYDYEYDHHPKNIYPFAFSKEDPALAKSIQTWLAPSGTVNRDQVYVDGLMKQMYSENLQVVSEAVDLLRQYMNDNPGKGIDWHVLYDNLYVMVNVLASEFNSAELQQLVLMFGGVTGVERRPLLHLINLGLMA